MLDPATIAAITALVTSIGAILMNLESRIKSSKCCGADVEFTTPLTTPTSSPTSTTTK